MRMFKAITLTWAVFFLLSFSSSIYAASTKEVFSVTPKGFEKPFEVSIHLPNEYAKNMEKSYFVILDLHPKSPLYLSGLHDWLSHNGEWPWLETIVVTPSAYHPEFAALFEETAKNPNDMEMLDFIETHILKEVDKRYRTNKFRIFSGFMSNGAIGLYALVNKPEMFNALIVSSPSIGNNFLSIESDFSKKLKSLKGYNRFLYMAIGDHGYEKSNISAFDSVKETLTSNAPNGLEWHAVNNNENYYMSRPVISLINGIERLFDDIHNNLAADSEISKKGFDAIVKHYEFLSADKYGFDVSAQGSLKNLAKAEFKIDATKGLAMFERIVLKYPDSAYAHSDLAERLAEQGKLNKAISMQHIAVDKAKTMVPWHQNNQQKKLDKLLEMLDKTN